MLCLYMMKNKQYYDLYLKQIEEVKKQEKKPSLLLHVCCGVCACDILTYLNEYFDITIYYCNDNIFPYEEFQKRERVIREFLNWYDNKYSNKINLVVEKYQLEKYQAMIEPYKNLPEFSDRCWNCYKYRMNLSFQYAQNNEYDYVATVMSVSRYKNANKINEIGEELARDYSKVTYLYTDFKKNKGEERSNKLSKELNLYRQAYCGCEASLKESKEKGLIK